MTHPVGNFTINTSDAWVRLQTGRIGLTKFDLQAPITAGSLQFTARTSELVLELNLAAVKVGNPLMQAAARALVGTDANSRLMFDAKGARDDLLRFEGQARAGDVVVPMEVRADLGEPGARGDSVPVTLTGWARFTDVHIPLPGMSRVNTLEVDVSASLEFLHE